MNKKVISFLLCIFVTTTLAACTNKQNNKVKNPVAASNAQLNNYEFIYNWSISPDKNNPEQIKKVLKMLCAVDFKKLHELELQKGKEIKFYEPLYNYANYTSETIEDIFKIREATDEKNQWDRLIFDLNKKEQLKPIFTKVIAANPKYKSVLENIIKTETNVYLVYNWGISKNKNDPKQVEKVLKVIGAVNFNKLLDMETYNNKQIEFYKAFYNYPNHNFETIKNIFDAKTDGAVSEDFSYLIFNLYKKNNVKPIIEKVVNSNSKYKEKLDSIIKYESQ
jgi:hypothetical protein